MLNTILVLSAATSPNNGQSNLEALLLNHEPTVRLGGFLALFGFMAAWEFATPRRALRESKSLRWGNNLALSILNTLLMRIALPVSTIGLATFATDRGMSLLNIFRVSPGSAIVLSLLALDLAIYLLHLMFHAMPLFWRAHRVHHADLDFDVTTGATP